MVVIAGVDERLGHVPAGRLARFREEDLSEQPVPEGFQDQLELRLADHALAELGSRVAEVVIEFFVPLPPGAALPLGHHRPGFDRVALLGLPGPDLVHVEVDIDTVSDRLLVGIFADQVLVKEPERLLNRGSGQADQVGVEVLQHRPPPPR